MASQAERREKTRGAILAAAEAAFSGDGFAATTIDRIAAAAGVAKGAVYHHFASKEALFEAVFDQASRGLVRRVIGKSVGARDVLDGMVVGSREYFAACAEPALGRIILHDGPMVLGWERWRQIDAEHFGRMFPIALTQAMDQGLLARQPVEPLARLLVGAVTEAAVACASAEDPAAVGRQHAAALEAVIEGLRRRA
ncbi:TetR/AcrR family transcriptional regulator [Caulobacter sp. KR2-114]|uniref:TetR/AcrR family transcriptional regulator n=1 Tax=Caulobacter sp. KR2-114 TaxID=3400912 RepID=UPI003BFDE810